MPTTFKKSPQKANNKTEDCIILAQTGCELLLQTRIFGKVHQHCFGPAIVSHHALSFHENCHRLDRENKVAPFLSALPLV